MIITIDGPAGVGKTTVGKLTANKLGIGFLDTGIMYRALTWSLLKNNIEDSSIDKIVNHLENLIFDLDIRNPLTMKNIGTPGKNLLIPRKVLIK